MTQQAAPSPDLFGYTPDVMALHPVARGKTDTSAEAADKVRSKAALYRERVLACVKRAGGRGICATDCAHKLRLPVTSVRPRFTELKDLGRIRDSGLRAANTNGLKEIVWVMSS